MAFTLAESIAGSRLIFYVRANVSNVAFVCNTIQTLSSRYDVTFVNRIVELKVRYMFGRKETEDLMETTMLPMDLSAVRTH